MRDKATERLKEDLASWKKDINQFPGESNRFAKKQIAEIEKELKFREDRLLLPAVVRRRKQSQFALQFTLARDLENRPAIVALQKVVRTLEQLWLKSRKREMSGPDAA